MNIIDVVIILLIALGAVIGFKRGFFKQTVSSVGGVLAVILAFILKNPVSQFMYERFPFFNFKGIFNGVTSLNILIYEIIAFLVVLIVLVIILRILVWVAGLIEKALKATIILGIPSKILGGIMGLVEAYIVVFIVLYVLTLPFFNISIIKDSNLKTKMLNNTPIISKYADTTVKTFNEIFDLRDDFKNNEDGKDFNKAALRIMLKNKVVTVESVELLVEKDKLNISGIDAILDDYR
ncbi:MAG: CvpA family protein [Bacilli bacterium]|nr:CvpA family protein [Bacilli bacterium]